MIVDTIWREGNPVIIASVSVLDFPCLAMVSELFQGYYKGICRLQAGRQTSYAERAMSRTTQSSKYLVSLLSKHNQKYATHASAQAQQSIKYDC